MSIHNLAIIVYDPALDEINRYPITPASPPGVLTANHFRASFGYQVRRPAGTRDWLLTFTINGIGRYRLGDQIYLCRAGDVMLLEPGVVHDYATHDPQQPWEFYWSHFLPRPHWMEWLQVSERVHGLRRTNIQEQGLRQRIETVFVRMLHDLRSSTRFQSDFAANALEEILICVAQYEASIRPHALDTRVDAVLQRINARYRESVTIDELAHEVSLSPSRLSHLFKEQVGNSIIEMLLSMRLHQTERLLKYTSLHLAEIAKEVGFQSASYCSRQFKYHYGLSPLAYRQHHQEKPTSPPASSTHPLGEA